MVERHKVDAERRPAHTGKALASEAVLLMADVQAKPERSESLEQILQGQGGRIYNLARRMLNHVEDAEDLTQQVLLQVFQKIDQFRGEAALSTWIYRITVNAAFKYRQRRTRQPLPVGDPFEDFLADGRHARSIRPWRDMPLQGLLDKEARETVDKAIAELPESFRDVYLLTDVEKLPIPDVARLLDLTIPAMKSRLHRARLMLRKELAPYFEEAQA